MAKQKGERRIPKSGKGRLSFERGGKHAMDVQETLANELADQLAEKAVQVQETLAELADHQQIAERLEKEDRALITYLQQRYLDRKHIDHLVATLRIFRLRRALARLEAAEEGMRLVNELLTPDPLMSQLLGLIEQGQHATLTTDEIAGKPRLLDEQIARTKQHLQAIQSSLSISNGWIESSSPRRRHTREPARLYLRALRNRVKKNIPIPEDIRKGISPELAAAYEHGDDVPAHLQAEAYSIEHLGPYFFFRWREEDGHTYSICLSDITVQMPERFRQGRG